MAQIQSLAWELPYAESVAIKKKKSLLRPTHQYECGGIAGFLSNLILLLSWSFTNEQGFKKQTRQLKVRMNPYKPEMDLLQKRRCSF